MAPIPVNNDLVSIYINTEISNIYMPINARVNMRPSVRVVYK